MCPDGPKSGLRVSILRSLKLPFRESGSHLRNNSPHFTIDGLTGAWLPYGGGSRQYHGRNFAEQEIILGFAIMFSMLDIELLGRHEV